MTELCPLCGGAKHTGSTTFTADYGSGVVVVRNVPALTCTQCGEEWLEDNIAAQLEHVVEVARDEKKQVEVVDFLVMAGA